VTAEGEGTWETLNLLYGGGAKSGTDLRSKDEIVKRPKIESSSKRFKTKFEHGGRGKRK